MTCNNKLINTATICCHGREETSNAVTTTLLRMPTITKEVDLPCACIGDTLTYTVTIKNVNAEKIRNLLFSDTIPDGTKYKCGSFTVNNMCVTPTITGQTLCYKLCTLAPCASVVIRFQVIIIGDDDIA